MTTYPTKVRYGLRFLVRLALRRGRYVPVSMIAAEENISVKYLEQIVASLKPLRALKPLRGARGGYLLTRDPEDMSAAEILTCLGGMDQLAPCFEPGGCERAATCTTRPFWLRFDAHMRSFLEETTLADIMAAAPGIQPDAPAMRDAPFLSGETDAFDAPLPLPFSPPCMRADTGR